MASIVLHTVGAVPVTHIEPGDILLLRYLNGIYRFAMENLTSH